MNQKNAITLEFPKPRDAWEALSMKEKAEMIGVAVRNGITNLNDIRDRYNEFAEGGSKEEVVNTDEQYLTTMEKVAEDNHQKWGFSNPDEALLHALNDNTYNYRGYYGKYPQSRANADTHWTDEFKTVYHPTFSNESIYSGQKSQYNPLGLPGGFWSEDTFVPMAWQLDANEYKKGGGIHIAPSKRGTFTAAAKKHGKSVQAFASQVLAHPENYSLAMRRKANFARNAAKWHGLGGNLFSGEEEGSQQMNKANIFRRSNGEYFYQASPDSKEIAVTPIMTTLGDESMWTYQDENGKRYTPKLASNEGTITQGETPSIWENIIIASNNNYMNPVLGAPARWKASWNNNTNVIRALWDNPAVMGHPLGMAAKAVEHLASDEGISKTIRLYQNSDGSENARWMWQRSLTGDALTSLGLFPAAAEGYQLGNKALQRGKRFILDVGDRYQGMKDAATYRSVNGSMDARTIANTKWQENGGTSAGINKMGVNSEGDFGLFYPDDSMKGYYPSTAVEKGGEMTLTTHLGGDFPGEYSKDLLPMSKSEMAALTKYLKGIPERTYLGEVGKTKNYAEQYFNVKPSRMRAFKDAVHNRKEVNEPYWDEKGHIDDYMEEEDPIERSFYKHLYEANEPLSTDAYKFMLQEAAKDNGRFALRYDSSPMGLFNPQGFYENAFYESLLPLSPEEQVNAINGWMRSYYSKARPAYLKDGEVIIPRPFLMKNK